MIPKASLLSFLTISSDKIEHIVFLHLKQVNDVAPPKLYWYKNKGQNGEATFLWPEKKLKQWLLIGEDEEVWKIFYSFINEQTRDFGFNKSTIKFTIPKLKVKLRDTSLYSIDGIESIGRNNLPLNFKAITSFADIDFLINEANNCKYIEGYSTHPSIKPLYPSGLLSENTLLNYVNEQIYAQIESRGLYLDFKGSGKDEQTGEPTLLSGFIQLPIGQRSDLEIIIRDIAGKKNIGNAEIDRKTGKWQTPLQEPVGKGQILLSDKSNSKIFFGENFYLLKDITINTQIVSTVIRDLFGRDINVSAQKTASAPEEMIVWDFNAAPDERQGQIELSDKLKKIMLSLGKSVKFIDPYFFGDINYDTTTLKLGQGQEVFFNALITALIIGEIEHVSIIGYWQRAKNQSSVKQIEYFSNYKLLYKLIYKTLGKARVAKLKTFQLVNSKEPFHDRYWQGDDEVYYLSNSINGAYESRELTIQRQDSLSKLKLLPKFNRRLNGEVYDLKSDNVF